MTLQAKLEEVKTGFQTQADPESLAIMERAANQLAESEILEGVLAEGEKIPEFNLKSADGKEVNSRQLLAEGPLVLNFYRGMW